jgi:hypothetical protein
MEIANGSLVMIGLHTNTPQVFWNGVRVEYVLKVFVHNHGDDSDVKLVVGMDSPILAEMEAAGIQVRRKA